MVLAMASVQQVFAKKDKEIKLTKLTDEVVVNVTPAEAWAVINSYGDVGSYHSAIAHSRSMNGSPNEGKMGCERECTIENGRKDVVVVEKIIEYEEGSYYKYDVTDWKNFPIKKFYNTFGVKTNAQGQTVIYVISEYRLTSGLMTRMAKGKLKKGNHRALLLYKHYMETGEKNADPKAVEKQYRNA